MKAPKSAILATLPVTTVPGAYFSSALSHGFVSSNLRLSAIFSPSMFLINALTLSPTLRTDLGSSTLPHDISEMWRSPSAPPRSMNAPKLVTFLTTPSTVIPTSILSNSSLAASAFLATMICFLLPIILLFFG